MATYTDGHAIKKIVKGEEATTWGDSTNENFNRIEDALGGSVVVKVDTVTSPSTWTPAGGGAGGTLVWAQSDTANASTAGTSSTSTGSGRAKVVVFADGADLGGTVIVKIRGNTSGDLPDRLIFVKNALTNGRTISFNMNTGDDNSDFDLLNGNTAVIYTSAIAKGPSTNIAANSVNNALDSLQLASISVGTGSAAGTFKSTGNQDVILKSGHLTDASIAGSVTITDGADGDIDIVSNGAGDINLAPSGAGVVVAKKFRITELASQGAGTIPFTSAADDGTLTEDSAGLLFNEGSNTLSIGGLDVNGNADISGDLTLSAGEDGALNFSLASSIKIADNQAAALVIEEADNAYLTFKTSNSSEAVVLGKKLEAGSVEIEGSAFDIDGGDISAVTVSGGLTWSAAQNLNSQALTNVNIDSGDISAATISGGLTWSAAQNLNSQALTNVNIDSGDISAATISGGLTWSAAQDLNNQNLTNVDIDSGTIDGVTIGDQARGGSNNVAIGSAALDSLTSGGTGNVAVGKSAGTALDNDASDNNTIVGNYAGNTLSGAGVLENTLVGASAGQMAGQGNVAIGYQALSNVGTATGQEGDANTAIGYKAMGDCNNGSNYNVAIGRDANFKGQGASHANGIVAIGSYALHTEQTNGSAPNTAVGYAAGYEVGSGNGNVFVGQNAARYSDPSIANNVAIGSKALYGKNDSTFEGDQNVAVGSLTLENVEGASDSNTAIGHSSGNDITTGDNNTFLGYNSGAFYTTGSGNIAIGANSGPTGTSTLSDTLTIDNVGSADPASSFIYGKLGSTAKGLYVTSPATSDSTPVLNLSAYSTDFDNKILATWSSVAQVDIEQFDFIDCTNSAYGGGTSVFNVRGDGEVTCAGDVTANGTVLNGSDYAEYFEWSDGNPDSEDRIGLSVVLDSYGKCRVATSDDNPEDVIGVVSATANTIGDSAAANWKEKFIKDDFGRYAYEEDGDGGRVKLLNPEFDPDIEYKNREERKEWEVIGLMGKLRLRKGSPVNPSWKKMKDISSVVELWLVR